MQKHYKSLLIIVIILNVIILFCGCSNNKKTPKPIAYFKISFPEKTYANISSKYFSCDIPIYSQFYTDPNNSAWYYVDTRKHNATIYLTYRKIDKENTLDTLIESSRKLVYEHTIKAEAISETKYINDSSNVYGILYEIKGNAATSVQFFITDSINNFLRGSLYFNCSPNKDSLDPSVKFFVEDVIKIIETTKWE